MIRKNKANILTVVICIFGFQLVIGNTFPIKKFVYKIENQEGFKDIYLPSNNGTVSDFEQIFTSKQIKRISNRIREIKNSTGTEIAIVSLDSTYCNIKNFDGFVLQLANYWGVGDAKLDNGILIGISKQFRKIRICNGLGIETILSDDQTKEIMDNYIIPKFKKNKYFRGIISGLDAFEEHFLTHQIVII
jgi:uncharacterized protein